MIRIYHPNAKINIGLSVTEKRSDGFHNVETIYYPVSLCDTLTIETANDSSSEKLSFTCNGSSRELLVNNLCCKAFYLLDADYNLPSTRISLHKQIPVGAGLGGGSSDAAHTLIALNDLYELQISIEKLTDYARQLGSDCAFFLHRKPVLGLGRGDIIKPVRLSLARFHIVIIDPQIFVSTAEAFSLIKPQIKDISLSQLIKAPVYEWRNTIFNDFEKAIFKKFPKIEQIKSLLYENGAVYASMTGSGSNVYGIFDKKPTIDSNLNYITLQDGI